jgi:hypothetical protein
VGGWQLSFLPIFQPVKCIMADYSVGWGILGVFNFQPDWECYGHSN